MKKVKKQQKQPATPSEVTALKTRRSSIKGQRVTIKVYPATASPPPTMHVNSPDPWIFAVLHPGHLVLNDATERHTKRDEGLECVQAAFLCRLMALVTKSLTQKQSQVFFFEFMQRDTLPSQSTIFPLPAEFRSFDGENQQIETSVKSYVTERSRDPYWLTLKDGSMQLVQGFSEECQPKLRIKKVTNALAPTKRQIRDLLAMLDGAVTSGRILNKSAESLRASLNSPRLSMMQYDHILDRLNFEWILAETKPKEKGHGGSVRAKPGRFDVTSIGNLLGVSKETVSQRKWGDLRQGKRRGGYIKKIRTLILEDVACRKYVSWMLLIHRSHDKAIDAAIRDLQNYVPVAEKIRAALERLTADLVEVESKVAKAKAAKKAGGTIKP